MKIVRHIIISIILLSTLFLSSCIFINQPTKENGIIHLYVTIENNQVVVDKDVEFYEGEYLIDVLKQTNSWNSIRDKIWVKEDNGYMYKKSHAISYATLIVLALNRFKEK